MLTNKEIKTLLLADEETFFRLADEIVERLEAKRTIIPEWISEADALKLLHLRSKTSLWKLRTNGAIEYSAISSKHFLYSRSSIENFINAKRQKTF